MTDVPRGGRRRIAIGATIATIGTLVTLVFTLFPDFAPTATRCSGAVSATVSRVTVEPGVTWRQYVEQASLDPATYTEEALAQRGAILHYEAELHGYRRKPVTLRWSVVDAQAGTPVDDPHRTNQYAHEVTPSSCEEVVGEPIWVRALTRREPVRARVFLYDENGRLRGSDVSETFSPRAASPA